MSFSNKLAIGIGSIVAVSALSNEFGMVYGLIATMALAGSGIAFYGFITRCAGCGKWYARSLVSEVETSSSPIKIQKVVRDERKNKDGELIDYVERKINVDGRRVGIKSVYECKYCGRKSEAFSTNTFED